MALLGHRLFFFLTFLKMKSIIWEYSDLCFNSYHSWQKCYLTTIGWIE